MPALIGVSEFVEETTADYKSPITSTFVSRMQNMKQTISTLEEVSVSHNIIHTFMCINIYGERARMRRKKKINFDFDSLFAYLSSAVLNGCVIKIQLVSPVNIHLLCFPSIRYSFSSSFHVCVIRV